jgi:hypothetical protein
MADYNMRMKRHKSSIESEYMYDLKDHDLAVKNIPL